jgi:hypothetical protein
VYFDGIGRPFHDGGLLIRLREAFSTGGPHDLCLNIGVVIRNGDLVFSLGLILGGDHSRNQVQNPYLIARLIRA